MLRSIAVAIVLAVSTLVLFYLNRLLLKRKARKTRRRDSTPWAIQQQRMALAVENRLWKAMHRAPAFDNGSRRAYKVVRERFIRRAWTMLLEEGRA